MTSLRPVIAICGTTGVGKSKLAIQLALSLANAATVINADSMQVYAGLDIITNKVPESQMCGVSHQLMGFTKPGEQYMVGQWIDDASKAIDNAHKQNQVPIVVGGTSYWIQHLIFPNRLVSKEALNKPSTSNDRLSPEISRLVSNLSAYLQELFYSLPEQAPSAAIDPEAAFALYSLLNSLDPHVAARWHWKDTRKVLRSLKIIHDSGKRPSEIFELQDGIDLVPKYRTLFFWLYADPINLIPRLNERVDKMIEQGLLDEIKQLREIATRSLSPLSTTSSGDENSTDYTLGIYQSIGYREFDQYLASPDSQESGILFQTAVEAMKISTRQYAKSQVTWIRNKLLPTIYAANRTCGNVSTPLYLLDVIGRNSTWDTDVFRIANSITQDFLSEKILPDPLSLSETARTKLTMHEKPIDPTAVLRARRKLICPVCTTNPEQPVMIEEGKEWENHLRSRTHRRMSRKTNRDRKIPS